MKLETLKYLIEKEKRKRARTEEYSGLMKEYKKLKSGNKKSFLGGFLNIAKTTGKGLTTMTKNIVKEARPFVERANKSMYRETSRRNPKKVIRVKKVKRRYYQPRSFNPFF